MPTIEIDEGETEELIPADQAGEDYEIRILKGRVSFAHEHPDAERGTIYRPGDAGKLQQLNDSRLFAYAHAPTKIDIDRSGFLFDLFSNTESVSPSSRSGETGSRSQEALQDEYRTEEFDYNVSARTDSVTPGTNTAVLEDKTADAPAEVIETVGVSLQGVDTDALSCRVSVYDDDQSTRYYGINFSGSGGTTDALDIPYPPDSKLVATMSNYASDIQEVVIDVNVRDV